MLFAGIVMGTMIHTGSSDMVISAGIEDGFRMIGAIVIFVAVMLNTVFVRSILEWKPVNFLGNISYSFYAIHFLIMKTISETVDTILNQYLQRDVAFCSMILLTFPIIIFAAWTMDKYIDKPCIKLSAWFTKRLIREIQDRIEIIRNMTTAIFKNIKALITIFLQKYRNTQDSFVLVQASEKDDNSSPVSEDNGTTKEDNKHD